MKRNITKRILSTLLALVMVIGMIPISTLTAFAANKTEVEQIETRISAEHVPYAGKEYKDLYTWIDTEIYGRAQNSGSDWVDDTGVTIDIKGDGNFGEWYDIRYQFEAGRTYTAEYTYMINPAYEETHTFTESTAVMLTNPDPSKCTITGVVTDVRDSGRIVDVRYTMTIAGERSYPDIEAVTLQKITTPADGVQSETTALMYSNCTLTSQSWSPNVGAFEAGTTYTLTVNLHANEGYKFADDFAPVLGVEGYEKAADNVELLNSNKDAAVSFTYSVGNYTFIDTLELKPITGAADFFPVAGESALYFPDLFKPVDGAPYEKEWLSSRQWYNEDDRHYMEDGTVFEAGKTYSYHSIFRIKTENEGTYRFAAPTVQLENFIYKNDFQTEVGNDPLRIYVTFYYTCKFPEGAGGSADNPAMCYSYNEFKYAMESEDIRYVALGNINEIIPVGEEGLVTAIRVNGIKNLNLLGDATLTAPAMTQTTYAALLHTTQNTTLNISGAGSLTFKAVANNSYNAVIYNQGGSVNIYEGTLLGSYNTAVYGKAIWQEYGDLRISGGQLFAENALAPGNLPNSHSAVYINGGQAWIQGGTFKTENAINTIDLPYGLDIGQYATVDLSGGTFHGILLPKSSTLLANYMDEETYTPLSDGSRFNPESAYSQGYVESGKVVRIAWLIDHIDVQINAPIAGVDITENYFNVPTSGCQAAMYHPMWYKNGEPVTYGTFEAGVSYKVVMRVEPKPGYGIEFTSGITAALNNRNVAVKSHGAHYVEFEYDFGVCPNIVPEMALTVTAPKEGNKPSYTVGCGSDVYYAVVGNSNYTEYRKWYMSSDGDDWWEINSNHNFMSGYYYKFVVDIRTNNGYEFPLVDNGTIQPNVSATVNGYYANVIKAYEQDPSRYITVEYNFGECSDSIVEKITVENVTAPVAGEQPNYNWSVRGSGYQMNTVKNNEFYGVRNGMQWMTDDWDYVFPNEPFVPGKTYICRLNLVADDGFTFAQDKDYRPTVTATVNGKAAVIEEDWTKTSEARLYYTFTCAQPTVESVVLYGLDEPQAGKTPDTEVTTAYPERYVIDSIRWLDEDDGVVNSFEQGRMYTAEITVSAKEYDGVDGCIFADSVTAYIDGKEVTGRSNSVTVNNDNTLTVRYGFRKGASAPAVNPYVFVSRPVGATVNVGQTYTAYWQTSFIPTRTEIQYWDGEAWDQWDVQQPEKAIDNYDFVNANAASYRFRIVAYIGHDAVVTSDEFVITWAETPVNKYTVSFHANGGTGTMVVVNNVYGEYTLPANGFTAPNGKRFKAWLVGGNEKAVGDKITVTANTTVTAVWEPIPAGHTCNIKPVAKDEPSCTEGGKEAYYKCEGCGKFYEDALGAKEITDLASWGNLPIAEHKFGEYVYNNDATDKKDGTKTRSCSVCQHKETVTAVGTKWKNPFKDVKASEYFYTPVLWAVAKNITTGTSATTFSPDNACTRGQIVTFLWRASGSPEPTIAQNPFTDVKSNQYYYKAVLWAVEKGITTGMTPTTFDPNAKCTREQIVTFLWRSQGKPKVVSANPFTDVKAGAYYYDAVLWAVSKGITTGTSKTTFSPKADCTRGQIVTFLYRCLG